MSVTQVNSLIAAQSSDALTIARQAVAVETPNVRAAREQQRLARGRSDALRNINNRLAALERELDELAFEDVVSAKTATTDVPPGREPAVAVRTPGDALDGQYRVWIEQLATHTQVRSSEPIGAAVDPAAPLDRAGLTTAVTSGRFRINGETFAYNAARETLADLVARIHGSTASVSAAYDAATATLTLTARYSGNLPIELEELDGNFLAATRLVEPVVELGQNAQVRVAGPTGEQTVEHADNTIADLIPGVTLELIRTTAGPITVHVRRDLARPLRAARGFVAKFNQLMASLHQVLAGVPADVPTEGHGRQVREVHERLRQLLTSHARRLRDAGVQVDESQPDAPLKLEERRFATLVAQQPARVQADLGLGRADGPVPALRDYVHDLLARGGLGTGASEQPAAAGEPAREHALLTQFTTLRDSLQRLHSQQELLARLTERR